MNMPTLMVPVKFHPFPDSGNIPILPVFQRHGKFFDIIPE
jgi:hypothetical protein